jgi:hypothetical protein
MNLDFDFKKLGFVILNPDCDPHALRKTTNGIKEYFPLSSILCVVGSKSVNVELLGNYCKVYVGGNTITSLIDVGMENMKTDWSFIITAGTPVRRNSLKKHIYFLRSEKDILYPVVDRKIWFDEATVNGILLPTNAIKEVGKMGDNNHSLKLIKLLWTLTAIERGFRFKALVGARLI